MATENKTSQAMLTLRNMAADKHSLIPDVARKGIIASFEKYKRMEEELPRLLQAVRSLSEDQPVRNLDEIIEGGASALSFDPLDPLS